MKRSVFVILLTICLVGKSFACLNGETYYMHNEQRLYSDSQGETPYGHRFYTENLEHSIKELDSLYRKTGAVGYYSDKGLALIVLGQYKKAIALYQEIEMTAPDLYSTASNMGTAYELIGDNKQALFWIQKALKINEHSHHNSEWIHVNILKAKLGGEELISSKFLLNTDFGTDSIPKTSLSKEKLDSLSAALYHQLNERVSFVKPKDKIVAQLMFDMGNIAFLRGNYYYALEDYDLAKSYGYTNKLIIPRIKACADYKTRGIKVEVPNIVDEKRNTRIYIYAGLGAVIGVVLAFVMLKRRQRQA